VEAYHSGGWIYVNNSLENLIRHAADIVFVDGADTARAFIHDKLRSGVLVGVPEAQALLLCARVVAKTHPKAALDVLRPLLTEPKAAPSALLLAGFLFDKLGSRQDAQAAVKRVVSSSVAEPLQVLEAANLLVRLGDQELALHSAERAYISMGRPLEHAATLLYIAQVTAAWPLVEQLTVQLRQGYADGHLEKINESPRTHLLWCDDEALNLKVLDLWSRRNLPDPIAPRAKAQAVEGRRLRVGYLSSDFREHPTARLILGVLRHHDRSQFELFMYCSGWDDGSPLRKEVEAYFDHVHSVAQLSDEEAASLMRSHELDVLVELNGPTRAHRMGILRHRPAPVQIDYLGWPGSVGGRVVDYIVGDYHTIPEGAEQLYPEKVIRLHPTYQANDHAHLQRAPKPSRKDVGLPEDPSIKVLGMFNAINKVHQQVWDTWMAILRATPNAMLWILDPGPVARKAIAQAAQKAGVPVSRILASPKLPHAQHLARLQCCDLMLDPWPYGGHTSTADALFAGVPVIAMEGKNFASRVSGALLRAAGLQAMVLQNSEEYVRFAVGLLRNTAELEKVKAFVREQVLKTGVFDAKGKARQLEAAYRTALEKVVHGRPAAHLQSRPDNKSYQAVLTKNETVKVTAALPHDAVAASRHPDMTAKFDYLMSSERDFAPWNGLPRCRYLICSTARSGSNLVSDMLQQTQLAGQPMEYLNGNYVAAELRVRGQGYIDDGKIDVMAYLAALERRRTSPNGWFGVKAHFEHVEKIFLKNQALGRALLKRFDCFVQLRRRDKLAQAVSLYKARVTQVWSSLDFNFIADDDPRRTLSVSFEPEGIMRALADIVRQELAWEHCLESLELPFSVFWYEDFVDDYLGQSARLLETLGISEAVDRVSAPSIQRQSDLRDPLLAQFQSLLGCATAADKGQE
jgi:predicted O-linked N-acetylglucosamine transferase (SPINDLY family)/LPS sulfotransferase NodH